MENPYYVDPIEDYEKLAEHLGMQQTRTIQAKKAFLKEYRGCRGNVKAACERTGISRKTFYNWRDTDFYFKDLLPIVGMSYGHDDAEGTLRQLIRQHDGPSIRAFLRKNHPAYKIRRQRGQWQSAAKRDRDSKGRFKSFSRPKASV